MGMQFVRNLLDRLTLTPYALGKLVGVSQQTVRKWAGITRSTRKQTGIDLPALCKLRKLSGNSWAKFGKELDREFLEK